MAWACLFCLACATTGSAQNALPDLTDPAAIDRLFGSESPTTSSKPVPDLLADPNASPTQPESVVASKEMIEWLKVLIRENLPETYEDNKKWGGQKEVWDGIDIHREGLNIKTKRKYKKVNDGTWSRYQLAIVDPDEKLHIHFHKLETNRDGLIEFDVSVEVLLDVFGRVSQWARDVQLISLSANADAVCTMRVTGTVAIQMNPLKFPPDIIIKPHVDRAAVEVSYFRIRRISQLHGPLVVQLGKGLKHVLDHKVEENNEKLADKINRQLEKKHDKMVFSLQDWLQSKLPLPEQSAQK